MEWAVKCAGTFLVMNTLLEQLPAEVVKENKYKVPVCVYVFNAEPQVLAHGDIKN